MVSASLPACANRGWSPDGALPHQGVQAPVAGALFLVTTPPAMHAHNIVLPLVPSDSFEGILEVGTWHAGDGP
jgi:hypothetical protein